jgi:hypothetical protein
MPRLPAVATVIAWLFCVAPALAQGVDEGSLGAARQLGKEGMQAYKDGKYDEANDKLGRAYEVVRAPSVGVWSARALAKVGKLVEASERYLEVTRMQITTGDAAIQEEAKQAAATEREALLLRIPKLTIQLDGSADGVEVRLDTALVPAALVGAERPVNPGKHMVEAKAGDSIASEEVTLAEGESRSVTLKLPAVAAPPPPVTPPAATPAAPVEPAPVPPPSPAAPQADLGPGPGGLQRTLGWVGLGVGGAGLLFGGITGMMVLSKKSKLDDGDCLDGGCGPSAWDAVDSYNSYRTISTVGFVVGGVGLAAGAVLLITAPSRSERPQAFVSPYLGVASAGVTGSF